MPFEFKRLELPDVILVTAKATQDDRGFFMETYKLADFRAIGISDIFVQDNFSRSGRGVLRGLHYQIHPKAQGKLVSVLRGEIYDVAVDIRRDSPTYGWWVGATLSDKNRRSLYVPVGFVHGFCVLSAEADVTYKVTQEYAPEAERGIVWNDPELAISWPIVEPTLSPRDSQLPFMGDAENNFAYEKTRV